MPNFQNWGQHFSNKVFVSLMCFFEDMIQQETSRYKGEFAEACVKLAANMSLEGILSAQGWRRRLIFFLKFVEFLKRSYPVVQAHKGHLFLPENIRSRGKMPRELSRS